MDWINFSCKSKHISCLKKITMSSARLQRCIICRAKVLHCKFVPKLRYFQTFMDPRFSGNYEEHDIILIKNTRNIRQFFVQFGVTQDLLKDIRDERIINLVYPVILSKRYLNKLQRD